MMRPEPIELHLETEAGSLCALHWPAPGKPKVLALHGWLDNAASFIPMAEFLDEVDLVVLEFPGHGGSAWRAAGHWYQYVDYVADVVRAAAALEWSEFHLLGHSLGARVASAVAAAYPEKALSLTCIEGVGAACVDRRAVTQRLRQAVDGLATASQKQRRIFENLDVAVKARLRSGDLDEPAARLIVERGVERSGAGWRWRSDPRLTLHSPMRLDEAQALALLAAVEAPTLVINALPLAQLEDQQTLEQRIAAIPNAQRVDLAGHHHLHMSTPKPVAEAVLKHIHRHLNGSLLL